MHSCQYHALLLSRSHALLSSRVDQYNAPLSSRVDPYNVPLSSRVDPYPNLSGNDYETMVVTVVLRCVQNTAIVHNDTGHLANPGTNQVFGDTASLWVEWSGNNWYQQGKESWKKKLLALINKK